MLAFVLDRITLFDSHHCGPARHTIIKRDFERLEVLPGYTTAAPTVEFAECLQQSPAAVAIHCFSSEYLYYHMEGLLEFMNTHLPIDASKRGRRSESVE